ncbi:MAG: hypothetical protein JXR49_19555 [Acidobacteria bacterium]|nr:hypothetical protein [Acidobacteriota bacterium]
MPIVVTGERLIQAVKDQTFIKGGDLKCAEGVKYDFRLSGRLLKATYERPIDVEKLSETEKRDLFIEPGEMVFTLTEEQLNLPNNMMAELSPKRKLSHAGILAIGGFCIDPQYQGRLLVGLFNFSSTRFPLIPGKKVIAATFFILDGEELDDFPQPEAALEDFPDELIQVMQKYQPMAIASVQNAIKKLQTEIDLLRKEIKSQNEWYERFEQIADGHSKQIGDLINGLAIEVQAREKGEDRLTKELVGYRNQIDAIDGKINNIRTGMAWLKGACWIAGTIFTLIVVPILVMWLCKKFGIS